MVYDHEPHSRSGLCRRLEVKFRKLIVILILTDKNENLNYAHDNFAYQSLNHFRALASV